MMQRSRLALTSSDEVTTTLWSTITITVRMKLSKLATAFYWVFGVLTCAYYAFETEWVCSQSSYLWALFLPLWLMPISNASVLLLHVYKRPTPGLAYFLRTLNNLAWIVAILLTVILSPLIFMDLAVCIAAVPVAISAPFTFLGSLITHPNSSSFDYNEVSGFALLCIFYLLVAVGPIITTSTMRAKLKTWSFNRGIATGLPTSSCLALIICVVVVCELPSALTHACSVAMANSVGFKEALLLLRAVADDKELLRYCYGETQSLPWFFFGSSGDFDDDENPGVDRLTSREIYYRVTGKPFNNALRPAPPRQSMLSMPFSGIRNSTIDDDAIDPRTFYYYPNPDKDFAGDTVGGLVRGLSLSESSIRGWVDPNEAVASLSWKMRFHGSSKGKELRAQILLPPNAVVTGCTLTVNGVKRNAVIGERASSKTAYTIAANKGEKPLLVSTAGAGRVLLQSSTGWWGTDADLTVDIATPLIIAERDKAVLPMPIFTERNFEIATPHHILLSSSKMATVANKALTVKNQSGGARTDVEGSISNEELANAGGTIYFQRDPNIVSLIAEDYSEPKYDALQQIQREDFFSSTPVTIVVDGSSTMADWTDKVADVLKNIRFKNANIIWASDVPQVVLANADTTSPQWTAAIDRLRDSSCLGGQDNGEALGLALKPADSKQSANVVWIHSPQPVHFLKSHVLLSPLTEEHNKIRLFEYQVVPGPNEVVKSLDRSNAMVQVPHLSSITDDLQQLFDRLSGQAASFVVNRSYIKHHSSSLPVAAHSAEISQLTAAEEVFAHLNTPSKLQDYEQLAESHNLVTPLTSAVVLEHDADYKAYGVKKSKAGVNKSGLDQLTGGLIPTKPEPPMFLLVVCAFIMVAMTLMLRRRKNQLA
jgi:hypothetical protein